MINVIGFTALTFVLYMNTQLGIMCMWTAHLANLNVGVIAVIWSITPLLQAFFDYVLFRYKMKINLWIGMILMIIACALLSLQRIIMKPAASQSNNAVNGQGMIENENVLPTWIPVLFGLLAPCSFASGNIIIRYITMKEKGIEFKTIQLSTNPYIIINTLGLIVGAFIWTAPSKVHTFRPRVFLIGTIGGGLF